MASKLEFRLLTVHCVDETNSPIGTEIGQDEIALSAIAIDAGGKTRKIPEFKVGSFDDKTRKTFKPPKRLAVFDLNGGQPFPQAYAVTLMMAEKDLGGGLTKFVDKIDDKVKDKASSAIAAAAGSAIGGVAGGPIGVAVGAAVGVAVDKAFTQIKAAVSDDIFPPETFEIRLPSADQRFPGGTADSRDIVATFRAHRAVYRVICDWRLV